jgi:hypothetical protein
MISKYVINGIEVRTGDLICTKDGDTANLMGQFWRLIGKIIPGDVDHIVIYVGPEGRCVEAGAKGKVNTFTVEDYKWNAQNMFMERGPLIDVFYGVVYPLEGRGFNSQEIDQKRLRIGEYSLEQARLKKPYNLNFLDSLTEEAFYCSQLAYRAYYNVGINLNTGKGVPQVPGTESIIFPQEIWESCPHKRAW